MRRFLLVPLCALWISTAYGQPVERTIPLVSRYLNFPVAMDLERMGMVALLGEDTLTYAALRLAETEADYWHFLDVSQFAGETLTLRFDRDVPGIAGIYQSDTIAGEDSLYREARRPQFHFTSRRGWNNDPNGLVYQNGEYHLFYQHNPFERNWGNMHWGHAVSDDLVHWRELPLALYPDRLGTMFSGSAVVDARNTAGWGAGALVAAYTADAPERETQNMAYSNDGGRTFTKYEGNPVIDSRERWDDRNTRDPKVFWYEPGNHWVMALFESSGISIYTSENLKDWTYRSHTTGFWECPELFELPVDGDPRDTRWVMYGASGAYLIGDFDGLRFTPEAGKYRTTYGAMYAAQTYNNVPDGRRIQVGWGRIEQPGMAFNQMMLFPTELSLRSTPEGIRLFSEPIDELSLLHTSTAEWRDLDVETANTRLAEIEGDLLHVEARLRLTRGVHFSLTWRGNPILRFDGNAEFMNGQAFVRQSPDSLLFDVEVLLDRTSVEIFLDGGRRVIAEPLEVPSTDEGLRLHASGMDVSRLVVHQLSSIWKSEE